VFSLVSGCGEREVTLDDLESLAAGGSEETGEATTPLKQTFLDVEKPKVKLGFIKLTDCAPLVIAKEKGFFDDEGLQVELEAQSNWKVLLDRVVDGQLDGAHMLSGQPIGATIGIGTKAEIITAYSLNYNGNSITIARDVWEAMREADPTLDVPVPSRPITAASLRPIVDRYKAESKDFIMGMVFPVSTHNYELRYWLAASGIDPGRYTKDDINGMTGAEVLLSVTPPPQMPSTLEAGTIKGYCVGEPWNQLAIVKGIGVPVVTNTEIWKDNPEKVFAVTKAWNDKHPNTHVAIIKALIRAGKWLDEIDAEGKYVNREETTSLLSLPNYVGADREVIAASMTGDYRYLESDVRPMNDFIVFFDGFASYPHYSDCIWFLTQMRRWGQIADKQPGSWYAATAKSVYRPDIYRRAAGLLVDEGRLSAGDFPAVDYDGYRPVTSDFIDGKTYDARKPVEYVNAFEIGVKDE
jgi:nitrate/nitrite transport system substrate-binding protein